MDFLHTPTLLTAKNKHFSKKSPPSGFDIKRNCLPLHPLLKGTLAERLGTGLQNRIQQFESARYLQGKKGIAYDSFFLLQRTNFVDILHFTNVIQNEMPFVNGMHIQFDRTINNLIIGVTGDRLNAQSQLIRQFSHQIV